MSDGFSVTEVNASQRYRLDPVEVWLSSVCVVAGIALLATGSGIMASVVGGLAIGAGGVNIVTAVLEVLKT